MVDCLPEERDPKDNKALFVLTHLCCKEVFTAMLRAPSPAPPNVMQRRNDACPERE